MTTKTHKKNRLSIQFALDGFSFLVYDQSTLSIVQEKEVLYTGKDKFYDWLKVKLAREVAFRKQYKAVHLLHTPVKYTLVPEDFIEPGKLKSLFSVVFPLEETEMIKYERINDKVMLASITADSYNLLNTHFPNTNWKTSPAFLLEKMKNTKQWNIGVLVLYNHLHLVVGKENTVQLSNNFYFRTKDDLLYYILYAFDTLEIPVAQSSIQLFGNQNYLPLLKTELSRYHSAVYVASRPDGIVSEIPLGNLLLSNL